MGTVQARAHGVLQRQLRYSPWARGHLGLPVLLLLHYVLVRVALGWFLFFVEVLLSLLVVFLFIPNET